VNREGSSDAVELAERIRESRRRLVEQIGVLTDEALRTRPDDREWSIVEVLAHLPDVDRHWLAQALAIRADPEHTFVHFDDERWKIEHPDVRSEPLDAVLQAMQAAHETVLATLAQLDGDDLGRTARHPRGIPYAVRDVFLRYPAHDENHANQIAGIRSRLSR
jgi:uncharacterized damage-inducible protein DinB